MNVYMYMYTDYYREVSIESLSSHHIPLEVVTQKKDISYSKLAKFSGGGDVTLISSNGSLVIGVPTTKMRLIP